MNYCLICQEENQEKSIAHLRCIKKIFGVNYYPKVDLSLDEVSIKGQEMVGKLSISGVQAKLSLKLNWKTRQLEVVSAGGEYILKPQISQWPNLPENESLSMAIASNLGIETPLFSLIKLKDGSWAYLVKRFDRDKGLKRHQEDFCQILEKENKYKGSYEQIAGKIKEVSAFPGLDLQLFFERVLFFFLIGNGDAHLKNFSLIYDDKQNIRLSPAYDIVSSKLVIPEEDELAIPLNGKKNNLKRRDFDLFAERFDIKADVCYKNIFKKDIFDKFIKSSKLPDEQNQKLLAIFKERLKVLKNIEDAV
jgi:serine/threonine-protein kinase HipA